MSDNSENDDFFSKAGLSVKYGNVEVGQSYPIYGMITQFVNDTPGKVCVVVNHNIELDLSVDDVEKVLLLKERAFDPGIFVTTVTKVDGDKVYGECTTVIFGKRNDSELH